MNNSADFAPEVDPYQSEFSGVQNWREASCHPVSHPVSARHSGYLFFKRLFDIVLSSLALVALSPLFLAVAFIVKLDSCGPAFFVHTRVGKNHKPIKIYKFRTMSNGAEDMIQNFTQEQKKKYIQNYKLEDDPRITRVGKFLRKTSIDELPQLFNVLIGNISLVGPRPITEVELKKYGNNIQTLLSVKPGLTGYWQVHGRSDTTYEQRVKMDIKYIENRSLGLDTKIIFMTIPVVLSRKGAK